LPWLHGLDGVVSATSTGPRSVDELPMDCGVDAMRTVELVADVAPAAGRETIIASYTSGITVLDRAERVVMATPGYRCEGSADELGAVAVGRAYGDRLLAVAVTSGGHNEAATWVTLFRTGTQLEPVFTGVVEHRVSDRTTRGWIYLLPGGLLYQRPGGPLRFWRLDPGTRYYLPVLPDVPHDEPPRVSVRPARPPRA
jgi:hypothetical protein